MTKERLEKLVDESARCLHIRGRLRCKGYRFAGTNLQRVGECEATLRNDVNLAFRHVLKTWEPKEEEESDA